MDYEKKYNEALERAQNAADNGFVSQDFVSDIFPELAGSEDERIRKAMVDYFSQYKDDGLRGVDITPWIAYLEKQKDANKAIEAVERIDKYIDEHTANAHDMKDSNPDKKYYSGVDDTLSNIAGILISAYSEEKQKEQKPAEWSEEDERMLEVISYKISQHQGNDERSLFTPDEAEFIDGMEDKLKSLRPKPKADLDAIYTRGKRDGYWEGVKAERESCKTFHYEIPNWPPKMPDLPTEATTNEGISSIKPHWKPSEEQMKALLSKLPVVKGGGDKVQDILESLYDELSKL